MGQAGRRARHKILAAAHARLALHGGFRPDARQLHPDRAVFRRAAALDLRARAHGEREIRARCDAAMKNAVQLNDTAWLTQGPPAKLLAVLDRGGEEARLVGGAVRNVLLGHPPGQIDVATTALPGEAVRRAAAAGVPPGPTRPHHGIGAREGLRKLSGGRVRAELFKLLIAPRAAPTLVVMAEAGLLDPVLGGVPYLAGVANVIAVEAVLGFEPDPLRRLAGLAVSIAEDAERLWERLRLANVEHERLASMADGWGRNDPAIGRSGARAPVYRVTAAARPDPL